MERYRSEYVAKCDLEQGKAQMTDTGSQCGMQEAQSHPPANLAQPVTEPDISSWWGNDGRPLLAGEFTNTASDKELDLIRWSNGVQYCEESEGVPSQTLLVMMRRYGEPSSWPPQVDRLTEGSIAPLSEIELFRQGYRRWKGLDGPRVAFAEQATGWEAPQQYTTATGGGFGVWPTQEEDGGHQGGVETEEAAPSYSVEHFSKALYAGSLTLATGGAAKTTLKGTVALLEPVDEVLVRITLEDIGEIEVGNDLQCISRLHRCVEELDLIRWSNGVQYCEESEGVPSQTLLVTGCCGTLS